MLKNTFFFLVALVVFLVSSNQVAALHNPHSPHAIPEKSGVYNDPDHPGMKVRVFVGCRCWLALAVKLDL